MSDDFAVAALALIGLWLASALITVAVLVAVAAGAIYLVGVTLLHAGRLLYARWRRYREPRRIARIKQGALRQIDQLERQALREMASAAAAERVGAAARERR